MSTQSSRIAVLGAGAVGGMLGVLLAEAGHEVTVIASERTSTAINLDGLVLRSKRYGELAARVPARPYLTGPVDALVVGVKAPDLLAALSRVPARFVAGSAVAPLLNGVDHVPLLRGMYPDAVVVPMTIGVEATRVAPGVIEHLSPFADYAVCSERPAAAVDPAVLLRGAGLDVDDSAPDEATLLWRKLSFLGPFALVTTAAMAAIGEARERRPGLVDALVAETAAAAAASGVTLDPAAVAARLNSLPATMKSSMLKDAEAGATLELDAVAGPVLRAAPGGAPVTRETLAEIIAGIGRAAG